MAGRKLKQRATNRKRPCVGYQHVHESCFHEPWSMCSDSESEYLTNALFTETHKNKSSIRL